MYPEIQRRSDPIKIVFKVNWLIKMPMVILHTG